MIHSAEDTIKDTGRTVVDTVRDNPIPIALTTAGLAWLIFNMRSNPSRTKLRSPRGPIRYREEAGSYGDLEGDGSPFGKVAHNLKEKGEDAVHGVQRAAESVAHDAGKFAKKAKDSVNNAVHVAGDKISTFGTQASERGRQLGRRAEDAFHDNPLAVGAVALAVGTAVGLAIPITRRENQLMGPVHDRAMRKAEELAHDALSNVETAARKMGDKANKSLNAT